MYQHIYLCDIQQTTLMVQKMHDIVIVCLGVTISYDLVFARDFVEDYALACTLGDLLHVSPTCTSVSLQLNMFHRFLTDGFLHVCQDNTFVLSDITMDN